VKFWWIENLLDVQKQGANYCGYNFIAALQ